jgi:hypothetical protein
VELKKGETIMIDAALHLPASFLHEAFSDRSGVPPDFFELYYRGKRLEGEAALSSEGVGKDSTIEVKMRGRGGMRIYEGETVPMTEGPSMEDLKAVEVTEEATTGPASAEAAFPAVVHVSAASAATFGAGSCLKGEGGVEGVRGFSSGSSGSGVGDVGVGGVSSGIGGLGSGLGVAGGDGGGISSQDGMRLPVPQGKSTSPSKEMETSLREVGANILVCPPAQDFESYTDMVERIVKLLSKRPKDGIIALRLTGMATAGAPPLPHTPEALLKWEKSLCLMQQAMACRM